MILEVITKEDLEQFRESLLNDLRLIVQPMKENHKEWLKSREVRKMLNISPGTLQNLRTNGSLSFAKMGGIIYYSFADIQKMLQETKSKAKK
jgi:hypothetical protein